MLHYTSEEYNSTKQLKLGLSSLSAPLQQLQQWFEEQFGVEPINLIYEVIPEHNVPRLNIVWETYADEQDFNFDRDKFRERKILITKRFEELTKDDSAYTSRGLLIVNSNFSYSAIAEASSQVSPEELQALANELNAEEIWKIVKWNAASAIFFFHTEAQAIKYSEEKYIKEFTFRYRALIEKFDDFDYLPELYLYVKVDSKYKFEEVYGGNWVGYYRDN